MFTNAIVRTPGPNAAEGLTTVTLGKPDRLTLLAQHAAYVKTLKDLGLEVTHLPPLEGHPDAWFVEDAALVFPELAIVTRPGATQRRAEAEALSSTIAKFRPLTRLTAPATLDGGDVLQQGKQVFVGLSERTNAAGAAQLSELLEPHGYTLSAIPVPVGLHLKSSVTAAGPELLVLTAAMSARAEFSGYQQVVVPDDEAYAANVLWVNSTVIIAAGFPRTRALLERLGVETVVLNQSEVAKMDGALTCMSVRF